MPRRSNFANFIGKDTKKYAKNKIIRLFSLMMEVIQRKNITFAMIIINAITNK